MSNLIDALRTEDTLTTNGMVTNSTSLNHCVDLFFNVGAMRGKTKSQLIAIFSKAFAEDPLTALKLAFWARDVRGGAGERQIFRDIVDYLANNHTDVIGKNIHLFSEYGRWDDVLILVGTKLEEQALGLIKTALDNKDGLVAKWLPRFSKTNSGKKALANTIRKYLGLTPKEYRHLLSELSNTVEQAMCARKWNHIEYSKLPSKAMANNLRAFSKNDPKRFQEYMDSLSKGETKVNAGALYPYDVVKSLKHGENSVVSNAQWEALPNYLENSEERMLPICDVSGSMGCPAGGSDSVSCLDVCISLGMYISERNEGPFKDAFMTFSSRPELNVLKGSLSDRVNQLRKASWDMSTNLEATYTYLLNHAVMHGVSQDEMPTMLIIFSDMEFNSAVRGGTGQSMAEKMYEEAGYKMPKIVYWNLNARNTNAPVTFNKAGTALVSGFSPSLLTSLLGGDDLTPISMMMSVVNSERYDAVTI